MNTECWQRRAVAVAATVLFASCANTVWDQDATTPTSETASTSVNNVGKIGRLHDNLRRAKQRESFYQELALDATCQADAGGSPAPGACIESVVREAGTQRRCLSQEGRTTPRSRHSGDDD
jgi:hypothetical protein